jgi:hypothetical protein
MVYKYKIRKLAIVTLIWCFARLLRGIWGAFEFQFYTFVLVSLTENKNDSLVAPLLIIILFVTVEVVPILIVLDWSFMEIFVIRSSQSIFG